MTWPLASHLSQLHFPPFEFGQYRTGTVSQRRIDCPNVHNRWENILRINIVQLAYTLNVFDMPNLCTAMMYKSRNLIPKPLKHHYYKGDRYKYVTRTSQNIDPHAGITTNIVREMTYENIIIEMQAWVIHGPWMTDPQYRPICVSYIHPIVQSTYAHTYCRSGIIRGLYFRDDVITGCWQLIYRIWCYQNSFASSNSTMGSLPSRTEAFMQTNRLNSNVDYLDK